MFSSGPFAAWDEPVFERLAQRRLVKGTMNRPKNEKRPIGRAFIDVDLLLLKIEIEP